MKYKQFVSLISSIVYIFKANSYLLAYSFLVANFYLVPNSYLVAD